MNLVIIGGKSSKKIAEVVYKTFDDINILTYDTMDIFMQEAMLRSIDAHRILLMQDGVATEEGIYSFTEFVGSYYSSVRIVTICKDKEMVVKLGNAITSPYALHIHAESMKNKIILDMVSEPIDVLSKKYASLAYVRNTASVIDIVDEEESNQQGVDGQQNIHTPGGMQPQQPQPQQPEGKRGFFSKVFGLGPKQPKQRPLTKQSGLKPIGQGFGVDNFQPVEKTIFDKPEEDYDYSVFNAEESDLGLGVTPGVEDEEDTGTIFDDPVEEETSSFDLNGEEEEQEEFQPIVVGLDRKTEVEEKQPLVISREEEKDRQPNLDIHTEVEEDNEVEAVGSTFVPDTSLIDNLKEEMQNKKINKGKPKIVKPQPLITAPLDTVDDTDVVNLTDDIDSLMNDYEEQKNTRIVEKIVEKVVTVNTGHGSNRNRNGIRILLVTGDRKSGVTKLAMNLASYYAKTEKTLLVDFDRYRKGVVSYIGVENLIDEPIHIQNGVTHLKTPAVLRNITYLYQRGGFYNLLSMYGEEVTDECMSKAQSILATQTEYKTVIVDCPLENMYLMTELAFSANILICVDDNRLGVLNTLIGLNSCIVDEKVMTAVFNNSNYVIGKQGNTMNFKAELDYVVNIFGIEDTAFNWGNVKIIGTLKGTKELAERL